MLDAFTELVKLVSRSFYEAKYCVFLDFLLKEKLLPEDTLAERMHFITKDIAKLAYRLRQDRLIHVHGRSEVREWDGKTIIRTYYYIDPPHFVDVVRWRLHRMRMTLDEQLRNELAEKGYHCQQCKKTYGMLDVSRLVNLHTGLFECEVCGKELQAMDASLYSGSSTAHSRLIEQTNDILRLIKKLDSVELAKFNVEEHLRVADSFELALTGDDDEEISLACSSIARSSSSSSIELPIASSIKRPFEVEIRNEPVMTLRNDLPQWHTHSTITGQQVDTPSVRQSKRSMHSIDKTIAGYETIDMSNVQYYEKAESSAAQNIKTEAEEQVYEIQDTTASLAPAITVMVQGVAKDILTITDEDKECMNEEEYQKYYEVFMSL